MFSLLNILLFVSFLLASTRAEACGEDYVLNPGDCSTYKQCDNGRYIIRDCPSGLHWNAEIKVCDWPAHAGCSEYQAGRASEAWLPLPQTGVEPNPDTSTELTEGFQESTDTKSATHAEKPSEAENASKIDNSFEEANGQESVNPSKPETLSEPEKLFENDEKLETEKVSEDEKAAEPENLSQVETISEPEAEKISEPAKASEESDSNQTPEKLINSENSDQNKVEEHENAELLDDSIAGLITEAEFNCAAATKGGLPNLGVYKRLIASLKKGAILEKVEAAKFLAHKVWETMGYQLRKESDCKTLGIHCTTSAQFWKKNVHNLASTFGNTLKAINGTLECAGGQYPQNMMLRFNHYKEVLKCLNLRTPNYTDGYCHV